MKRLVFLLAALAIAPTAAAKPIGMPPWPVPGQPPTQIKIQNLGGKPYYCQLWVFRQRTHFTTYAYVERCAPLPVPAHKKKTKKASSLAS